VPSTDAPFSSAPRQGYTRQVIEIGLHWVRNYWLDIRRRHPDLRPRQSPRDTQYDVHVNFSMAAFGSVSHLD
jgi:hypothetical protein